ncbi:MAG: IS30 family transposase [Lachnospiraceae bacterium]|nr:IS30 family transposase [Lachnospiraceae bacterium]
MTKQLSLSERIVIEQMIHRDYSFASIGRNLNRSASTIAREVLHYRCFSSRIPLMGENDCLNRHSCQRNTLCREKGVHGCFASRCKRCPEGILCTSICDNYDSLQCDLLDKPPYVCSNCKMQKGCRKNKAYYTAHRANAAHLKALREAHRGVRKTPAELLKIAEIIEPLLAKGQSLNHICSTHAAELGVSERTLYNYIDKNVFKVRNIDLPKKVVYRQRRPKNVLTKYEYQYRQGRTIEDFKTYVEANPGISIVEMDTVKGSREKGKVLLTMIFRKSSFMLIFLMKDGTQDSVIQVFDALNELLGMALFKRVFGVILTDNGVEFKNPGALEHTRTGLIRTHVFFCDPQASWQKPHVENNHRLIRRILPKGTSFNKLNVGDIRLVCCHINSVIRENLDGKTPFELMDSADDKKLLSALNLSPIPPDEVTLSPKLIKH